MSLLTSRRRGRGADRGLGPVLGPALGPVLAMVLALAMVPVLSSCVRMPDEGPVVETSSTVEKRDEGSGTAYEPPLPAEDAAPRDIVLGFLEAMKATPVSTSVAAEFLTAGARQSWRPRDATVTYRGLTAPGDSTEVSLWANSAHRYDAHGAWVGKLDEEESQLRFRVVREGGQWRIDQLPDALLVPETWFTANFERSLVFFLEPTGRMLVGEPVHVPGGEQQATHLVRALLAGTSGRAEGVLRTAVPSGLSLALNAVPVDRAGTARLELTGPAHTLADGVGEQLTAQLAWTLSQVPRVRSMRVTLNGEPVKFPSGALEVPVDVDGEFAPWGPNPETRTFALASGRLHRGGLDSLEPTTGPFGTTAVGLGQVSVSLDGNEAVGVSLDGASLLRTRVEDADAEVETLLSGRTGLLDPVHDATGRVWVVEHARDGARVLLVRPGAPGKPGEVEEVTVPGVTGRARVTGLLVSADATRLVAVVRDPDDGDVLVSARLALGLSKGGRFSGRHTRRIPLDLPRSERVLDLTWAEGDSVGVLVRRSPDLSEVRLLAVEGAPSTTTSSGSFRIRPGGRGLAMSQVTGLTTYVYAGQSVRDLKKPATVLPLLPADVTWFGYAG